MHHELGEILTGDVLYTTVYDPLMNMNGAMCQLVCKKKVGQEFDYPIYKWLIEQEYKATWYADALPAGLNQTYTGDVSKSNIILHESGIPLGEKVEVNNKSKIKLYNHLTFIISVHKSHNTETSDNLYYIVEFNIVPYR
jgi:hypothetical protein